MYQPIENIFDDFMTVLTQILTETLTEMTNGLTNRCVVR